MTNRTRGAAALLSLAALFAVSVPGASAAGLPLRRCASQSSPDPTRCGRLAVPLDRGGAIPGEVRLRVRVLNARRRAHGTIFALAGGPGQAATPLIGAIAGAMRGSLRTRRLVTFDQRGTGRSGRLTCPSLTRIRRASQVDAAVAACARRLGARRTAYTSAASVDDIEAVRAALGIDRIVLFGVSYGTKVALDYAAKYPQHVSKLVLDSVATVGGQDPFMRTTVASIARVLDTLCANRRCPFTRDPAGDVATLVRRIAQRGALHGRVYDGRGRGHDVPVRRDDLLGLLLEGDFEPLLRARFPAAVRAAVKGDTALLARIASGGATGLDAEQDSDALNLATVCEDGSVPWPAGTPIAARKAATDAALAAIPAEQFAPFDSATVRGAGTADYCRAWPESPIPQPTGPLPDVPTLILSGDDDLRTPRKDAEQLATRIRSARLVTVPDTGHSVLSASMSDCPQIQLRRFLAGRSVRDCRPPRERFVDPTDELPPTSLRQLPGYRGLPPRIGRTLYATGLTLDDFSEQFVSALFDALSGESDVKPAFGGLRGGYASLSGRGLAMRRYSFVPGVTLTIDPATSSLDSPMTRMWIGGPAAARGTLTFSGRRATAELGGRRIAVDGDVKPRGRAAGAGAADPLRTLVATVDRLRATLADPPRPPAPLISRTPLPGPLGAIGAR